MAICSVHEKGYCCVRIKIHDTRKNSSIGESVLLMCRPLRQESCQAAAIDNFLCTDIADSGKFPESMAAIFFFQKKTEKKKCLVGSKRICFACCVWNKNSHDQEDLAHRTYSGTYMLDTVNDLCCHHRKIILLCLPHYLGYKEISDRDRSSLRCSVLSAQFSSPGCVTSVMRAFPICFLRSIQKLGCSHRAKPCLLRQINQRKTCIC